MLARVEIENTDGALVLRYNNPVVGPISAGTPTFSLAEKRNGLLYKGFFLLSEDQYIAREVLKALIRNLAIDNEGFIHRKHATLYAYIDNYLTTRNPAFSIPRKHRTNDALQLSVMAKKRVYVDVIDTIAQRVLHGQPSTMAYGQIVTRPTDNVGAMALKIDSRSLCGLRNIQFNPLVSTKREGITTFVTAPSKETVLMNYTFNCKEDALPIVKIVLIDAKTIEVMLCLDTDAIPESFRATLSFDFTPGHLSVECKQGSYEYVPTMRSLVWKLTSGRNASITVHCSEPHRAAATLKYKYCFSRKAISSVLVNGLSSEADENWIKHTTVVTGYLRATE
ncbi:hypothetical protein NEHOM01_0952 [Nematocida homosporus]|uniref:uncharacterized protein n=1 Tax=Nematocida homosporus TaxID=1912981 RepID=UPI00221F0E10|nr:uncharacterized protein NEHOM01_0952 [Nematocida homosporus]KAI5185626.1 hypothetical protein NEHOM01_0952 [Nematocida homosporus]